MTKTIKDASFRIVGYIEEEPNGNKTVKDASFRILGYYDSSRDITKDASFRIIAYGDVSAALLYVHF